MKYPKEYLDEIKTRLKVSTVVSKTVALKKKEAKSMLVYLLLKMKRHPHLQLMMKKNSIIVLQHLSTGIFLIL